MKIKKYLLGVVASLVLMCGSVSYAESLDEINKKVTAYYGQKKGCLPEKDYTGKVNVLWGDAEGREKARKAIWQELLTWGLSTEAAAGIMGNIDGEGDFDSTMLQLVNGSTPREWKDCVYGSTGMGITQWTDPGRQSALFYRAEITNRDWLDLGLQLEHLKWEVTSGMYFNFDDFKNMSIEDATATFLDDYENPRDRNYDERLEFAKSAYNDYKNVKGKAYDGSSTRSSDSSDSDANVSSGGLIAGETDLEGMEGLDTSLLADQGAIELPSRDDLSIGETYSTQVITDNLALMDSVNLLEKARVLLAFIGLSILSYAVLLLVAMIFDRINTFIEISLVGILTLGKVQYSPYDDLLEGKVGVTNTKKLVISICVLFVVGLQVLSGSIFTYMADIVCWFTEKFL